MISIYTDGSSHSSGGKPGGWAFVIVKDVGSSDEQVLGASYGGDPSCTNNRMELMGAIRGMEALETLKRNAEMNGSRLFLGQIIELVSDSQYTLGMANGSYSPSMDSEGKRKNGDLVDRIRELAKLVLSKDPKTGRPLTRWVPGHEGDTFNERCDSLAKRGKKESMP